MMLQQQEQTRRLVMDQIEEVRAKGSSSELKIRQTTDKNEDVTELLATFEPTMNLHNMDKGIGDII